MEVHPALLVDDCDNKSMLRRDAQLCALSWRSVRKCAAHAKAAAQQHQRTSAQRGGADLPRLSQPTQQIMSASSSAPSKRRRNRLHNCDTWAELDPDLLLSIAGFCHGGALTALHAGLPIVA